MRAAAITLSLCLVAIPAFAGTQARELTTPRGARVPVVVHVPEKAEGRLPALVIAPGQGYHMELPLIAGLARQAASRGVMAFRFDWAYTAAKGKPSAGLGAETEDMEAVLSAVLADERVDPNRVFLAGKSLGTMVSYRVFVAHRDLSALFLLTPIAHDDLHERYPGLAETTRPILMVLGTRDPLCPLPKLYASLATTKGNVATVMVDGDHGMNVGSYKDEAFKERNAANVDVAVGATLHWLQLALDK